MKIVRERAAIMRNNRTEILVGDRQNFRFCPINELKNVLIKTYRSKQIAINSFKVTWTARNYNDYEPVMIREIIEVIE